MDFRLATFNCRDFFDDAVPHVIGQLDREGFGVWAQRRARTLFHRKLEAIATAVARTDADVIAFQEIEGAHVLDALRATLGDARYLPAACSRASPSRRSRATARASSRSPSSPRATLGPSGRGSSRSAACSRSPLPCPTRAR
jgi:hypothetical protein